MIARVTLALLLVTSTLAFATPMQPIRAEDPNFGEEIDLSKSGASGPASMSLSGSGVYVLWPQGELSDIFLKVSNDNGDTWNSRVTITNNNLREASDPAIAVSGNNVYVLGTYRPDWVGGLDIFFKRSIDGGSTFDLETNLSGNFEHSMEPGIAASGSNVFVVWRDHTPDNYDIFFRRSTDNGVSFDSVIQISNLQGEAYSPGVALSGNNVYVIWSERTTSENIDVYVRMSNDYGATFGPTINLSNNAGNSYDQEIAVSDNNVYVIWKDATPGHFDIFFRASNDNGATFGPTINLSNTSHSVEYPQLAVSGSNVYVVWDDNVLHMVDGVPFVRFDVFFSVSNDNGATFSNPMNLSDNLGTSQSPELAASGNNVYVLWRDSGFTATPDGVPVGGGMLLRTSDNNGATFSPTFVLTEDSSSSWWGIAASGNYVHVIRNLLYSRSPPGYADNSPWPILPEPTPRVPPVSLSASASSAPSIDGIIGITEWVDADTVDFVLKPQSEISINGTIHVMNDQKNLYIALKIGDTTPGGVVITFDNDNDGLMESGDDILSTSSYGMDWSITSLAYNAINSGLDHNNNGTEDGRVGIAGDDTYNYYEFSHPLCSSDTQHDFCLSEAGAAGFTVQYYGKGGDDAWPAKRFIRSAYDAPSGWGEITIAHSSFTPPEDVPPPDNRTMEEVSIDIKPNSDTNKVNCLTPKGGVSVGLYTEDGFDAQDVDVSTLELQGVEAKKYLLKDLDSDGDLDGVARFNKADLCESDEILSLSYTLRVTLTGSITDGNQFEGDDIIRFRR